ncbi:MAG: hypothetical protein FWC43_14825 [Planctomycetaceae bacterium]|nr:hypothetical protein [Planctomycetaceae bacterium]
MPIIYQNCHDEKYFLHEGKTKTGKSRYYFSKKEEGNPVDTIPDGYEIYERPGGMVYLRKEQKAPIWQEELEYVQNKIAGMIDQESEDKLSLLRSELGFGFPGFTGINTARFTKAFQTRFEAEIRKEEIIIYEVRSSDARPLMKFVLKNEEERLFSTYRWCFKGRIDGWIHVGGTGSLKNRIRSRFPLKIGIAYFC